jgi:hypothetical protein
VLPSTAHRRERLSSLQLPGTVWLGSVPIEPVRRLSTGIIPLDTVLGGGLPRGGLSEIAGPISSGRTALLCALLATATRQGEVVAVVDLPDALHPESLTIAGTDLHRVLWVRPPSVRSSLKCADLILSAGGFGMLVLDLGGTAPRRLPLHVWPRFVRTAKQSHTAMVVLAEQRVVGSFSTLSLVLTFQQFRWSAAPRVFNGLSTVVGVARSRGEVIRRNVSVTFSSSGLRTED